MDNVHNIIELPAGADEISNISIEPSEYSEEELNEILQNNNMQAFPLTPYAEEVTETPVVNNEITNSFEEFDEYLNGLVSESTNNTNTSEMAIINNTQDTNENTPDIIRDASTDNVEVNEATSRFSGTEWFNIVKTLGLTVVGVGGIGSWTSLLLARLNINHLRIYDHDIVDLSNLGGQLYGSDDLGGFKANKISQRILSLCDSISIYSKTQEVTSTTLLSNIVVCGLDSMEARKTVFNNWKQRRKSLEGPDLFIDGRLSIDTLQVFCFTSEDKAYMEKYEKEYLFSDAEADETICSRKQTSYMASMIGSIITNIFVNFAANLSSPMIPYDVPFLTEYNAQTMIFKTIH